MEHVCSATRMHARMHVRVSFSEVTQIFVLSKEMTDDRCLQEIIELQKQQQIERIKRTFFKKHGSFDNFDLEKELAIDAIQNEKKDDRVDEELKETSRLFVLIMSMDLE